MVANPSIANSPRDAVTSTPTNKNSTATVPKSVTRLAGNVRSSRSLNTRSISSTTSAPTVRTISGRM